MQVYQQFCVETRILRYKSYSTQIKLATRVSWGHLFFIRLSHWLITKNCVRSQQNVGSKCLEVNYRNAFPCHIINKKIRRIRTLTCFGEDPLCQFFRIKINYLISFHHQLEKSDIGDWVTGGHHKFQQWQDTDKYLALDLVVINFVWHGSVVKSVGLT